MTLFIFLPAAARTRIVAADLWLVAAHSVDRGIVAPNAWRSGRASGKTSGPRRQEAWRRLCRPRSEQAGRLRVRLVQRDGLRDAAGRPRRRVIADDTEL